MRTLQFTIGPVQGFIAQSRRTRDLLAGSFLLSYLSGRAMMYVIEQGGSIVFPFIGQSKDQSGESHFQNPLLQAIYRPPVEKGPWIGTLPNRFTAMIPDGFQPEECVEAVKAAWRRMADAVWEYAVARVERYGNGTREIWNRQVCHCWEITWVIGEDGGLLDRRKAWRSFVPTIEPGDKCTLMPHLQELSGYLRNRKHERQQQEKFWKELRERLPSFELAENERLSAIALIKRLYPLVSKQALGWDFPRQAKYFPSTSHLAALPWIEETMEKAKDEAKRLAEVARDCELPKINPKHLFPHIYQRAEAEPELKPFSQLEGRIFFPHELEKFRNSIGSERVDALLEEYRRLTEAVQGEPQPYYALLFMDGDGLGNLLQKSDNKKQISQAVANFAAGVAECVKKHHGVTIYAGGDDVLAMFTRERVLSAAVKLRQAYMDHFRDINRAYDKHQVATISASIVYAHYFLPLQKVLEYGRKLLDEVAKDKTGRDSLAVGVWKRSGAVLEWSAPWDVVIDRDHPEHATRLEQLAEEFRTDEDEAFFSGRFVYKLKKLYEGSPAFSQDSRKNREILTRLITADYLRIKGTEKGIGTKEAEARIKKLLDLCFRSRRDEHKLVRVEEGEFLVDGALLVRFLAQKGGDE
ncbi:type III-B CRISPR-associated protein Cas10/Cmr2 [Lihuaxuella thermophila]|uniref:CRISPR-associated protein Cmr2 n=1 Tax=Lihuaxuella thermophila TaxID=1173111 RepID=A0A1H8IKJ7_9BACL|nr:type III-B CRISPR-associated protein Cas10/Cmr2 [Lihuaxuella thermophila]SEN69004.1 CRISPR-associated protein Cmr2 [Lihuaxuella thermophila]